MSRKALALVAVSGLVLAGYASAASAGLLPESVDMGMGKAARCQRADANADNSVMERCQEPRKRHARDGGGEDRRHPGKPGLAPFRVENGTVEGKWVSFQVDGANGALLDYTSKGPFADAVVFDRVAVSPVSDEDGMRVRGPLWVGKEGKVGAASFNAPNAFLGVRNFGDETATVTYDLGAGIAAEQGERGIVLTRDGHKAGLLQRGNATLTLDGEVVTATLGKGDAVVFAIDGYPRLLHHEARALHMLAKLWQERRAAEPGAEPAPEPLPPEAEAEVGAEASAEPVEG